MLRVANIPWDPSHSVKTKTTIDLVLLVSTTAVELLVFEALLVKSFSCLYHFINLKVMIVFLLSENLMLVLIPSSKRIHRKASACQAENLIIAQS